MKQLKEFLKENEVSGIVYSEWTDNGKTIRTGTQPATHMRIRLRNKREFLLERADVAKLDDFAERWHDKDK